MAKKTRQHHIDDAAKQVVKDILNAVSWNVELSPDYGIDFRVQMLDGEDVSWRVFLVQLKGHERLIRGRQGQTVNIHFRLDGAWVWW